MPFCERQQWLIKTDRRIGASLNAQLTSDSDDIVCDDWCVFVDVRLLWSVSVTVANRVSEGAVVDHVT